MEFRNRDMGGRVWRLIRRSVIGPFTDAPPNRKPLGIVDLQKAIELCAGSAVTVYAYHDPSHNAHFFTDTCRGVFEGIEEIGFKKVVFTPEIYCRYGEKAFYSFMQRLRPNSTQIFSLEGLKLLIEHTLDSDDTWNSRDYKLPSQY